MSSPVELYREILDRILLDHDLSHDFGRKQAYEAAVDYAREHLAHDPAVDEFLAAAAERLGFATISFRDIENRVKLPKGAWLDVWISEEEDEIALTGTKEGLEYLIQLLSHLKDSRDRDEHVHLDRGYGPMTEASANLVLFREDESWFTGTPAEGEFEPYPAREIEPEAIYAMQFLHLPPDDVPITANKLYRVTQISREGIDAESAKDFPEGASDRYRRFTFISDRGEPFTYTFHLDDPGVNYFTHREILSLAMRVVS